MSKILLAAVNASFSHTNIAVRSLALYSRKTQLISFDEWTINQLPGDILRGIVSHNPKIVIFSTYIWNIEMVVKIIKNLRQILPDVIIGAGGPEVSFSAEQTLNDISELDFISCHEGEVTTKEICEAVEELEKSKGFEFSKKELFERLKAVKGLYLKSPDSEKIAENSVFFTGVRELLPDLSTLPFPYPEISEPDNKIYYYESSRGCPFSCAYCMSSLDKRVRFMPLERVFNDLQKFLDAGTKLVKFVDRTYNLNEERYISIWNYILDHHNGKTMFHFEIEAEFLSEKALDFLQKVPEGVMQFEIGIQSANSKTLKAVNRSPETAKLAQNIKRIPPSIHCHVDLIAGLPYENLESFGDSFDFAMSVKPDELQLGFLKVLYGTQMKEFCEQNGWRWMKSAPYEVLSTPFMSYNDICFLKDLEILLDAFYNSRNFEKSITFIGRTEGWWHFFSRITNLCQKKNIFNAQHAPSFWFDFLASLSIEENNHTLYELLRFDFVKSGKKGGFPEWYKHFYNKDLHKQALDANDGITNTRINFAFSEYEEFDINPLAQTPESTGKTSFLFYYKNKAGTTTERQILLKENE